MSELSRQSGGARQGDPGRAEVRASGAVALLGIPSDEHSSFMRGAALAPAHIRFALHSTASNLCTERGLDLGVEPRFVDRGDLKADGEGPTRAEIEAGVASLLAQDACVLALGGDHAVTYPIVRAYATRHPGLTLLHLDAHPDLYDEFEGDRFSHACPMARIMEEGLVRRLVQVGIRGMNRHQQNQAERFGVEVHAMHDWRPGFSPSVEGPVYLSLDMDVLDPAFAPGVSHPEAGGLSTRDVLRLIRELRGSLVGADIVELNPQCDPQGITAVTASKLLKEIVARMFES